MKKVISFSLWGNNKNYTLGAIKCAEMAKLIYPEFECWFYVHKPTVPADIIDILSQFSNVIIFFRYGDLSTCKPMTWRFEAIDHPNVELVLSRDTDARFTLREKLAVQEWLDSSFVFHIMRDHPHHNFFILGGMFGTRKIKSIPSWISLLEKLSQTGDRNYDQDFLRDIIYPEVINNSLVHATFHKFEDHSIDFPLAYDAEFRFVGEYIYHDDKRSNPHLVALLLALAALKNSEN